MKFEGIRINPVEILGGVGAPLTSSLNQPKKKLHQPKFVLI